MKPKSDGSDTEVKVQYHLQKQDCQPLAASETGDTENRPFFEMKPCKPGTGET